MMMVDEDPRGTLRLDPNAMRRVNESLDTERIKRNWREHEGRREGSSLNITSTSYSGKVRSRRTCSCLV